MNVSLSFNFTLPKEHFIQLAVAAGTFTAIHSIIQNFALVPPNVAYTAIAAVTIVAITASRSQRATRPTNPPAPDIYIDDFIAHQAPPRNRHNNLPAHPHQPARRNNNQRRNILNPNNANIVD